MTETSAAANEPAKPEFTFITTCKGRLHHLQQTLPLMAQQANCEVIVVDYNCPQRTGDWVEANFPQVGVVRVTDDEGFCVTRARNLGAAVARAPWLIFIDADVRLTGDLLSWLRPRLAPATYFRAPEDDFNLFGTHACQRGDFEKAGGYDEILHGWGREDKDLYYRLSRVGCRQVFFPADLVSAIRHGDDERMQFYPYKDKQVSQIISSLYLQMKYDLEDLSPEQATPDMHRKLHERAREIILQGLGQPSSQGMRLQMMLGAVSGPASVNQLFGIERTLVYLVRKPPQRTAF